MRRHFCLTAGVHGLRIVNTVGNVVLLPFQGQQVWSCNFHDRELTMNQYYSTCSNDRLLFHIWRISFALRCNCNGRAISKRHPSASWRASNAPYQKANLQIGSDENGRYIALGGKYHYMVAFNHNYIAEPLLKVYENSSVMDIFHDDNQSEKCRYGIDVYDACQFQACG